MWGKGNPCTLLVKMQIDAATVESSVQLPQKIKNGTALWPRDSIPGNLSKETQNTNSKEYMHPHVNWCIIYNTKILKQPKCPLVGDKWIKMLIHIYNGILLCHNKEWNLTISNSRMDQEGIMLSEISQSDINSTWFHLYVESRGQNKQTK